ncbi:MAG: hypothetical protein M1817_002932 [Caeruleum heppii]|nr:MAG: hypothetical protein M1817_002932 [Caeruleum heppii]
MDKKDDMAGSALGLETLSLDDSLPPSTKSFEYHSTNLSSLIVPSSPKSSCDDSQAGSAPKTKPMLSILEAIFHDAEAAEGGIGVLEFSDYPGRGLSEECLDEKSRVEALNHVRGILDQLWWTESSFVGRAAEVLANGSRDEGWRIPLGDSGVLEFFLRVLVSVEASQHLILHTLRLLGNACAETDTNRARVVQADSLTHIVRQLKDPSLYSIAVPVLYNICVDYEPAQEQAARLGLVRELLDLTARESLDDGTHEELLSYLSRLVEIIVEMDIRGPLNVDTAYASTNALFQIASKPECPLEEFLIWVDAGVGYLSNSSVQHLALAHAALGPVLAVLVKCSRLLRPLPSSQPETQVLTDGDRSLLLEIQSKLIDILSEISALPEFHETYPLTSPLVDSLERWIGSSSPFMQGCACIMLGNLARTNGLGQIMVRSMELHKRAVKVLEESSEPFALHAAASLLRNLTVPAEFRATVGNRGVIKTLPRLWLMDKVPELQYAAVALARRLVTGCFPNVRRLLEPLSSDLDSPANSRTLLSCLLLLWETNRNDGIRTEIGRLISAVIRELNKPQRDASPGEVEALGERLYVLHPDLARPLASMVSQTQYPVVASEGWFTLALLSKEKAGAAIAAEVTLDIDVLQPMAKIVTGSRPTESVPEVGIQRVDDPAEPLDVVVPELELEPTPPGTGTGDDGMTADMRIGNRSNAIILASNLLEHQSEEMPSLRRQILLDLLDGRDLIHQSFEELRAGGDLRGVQVED